MLSGCGQTPVGQAGGAGSAAAFTSRAAAVATRWAGTAASAAWRTGLVPLQDLTIAPDGFPDSQTKDAFANGVYVAAVALPSASRKTSVRFADGSSVPVTAVGANAAYRSIRMMGPSCEPGARPSPTIETPPDRRPGGPVDTGPDGTVSTVAPPICYRLTITSATAVTTTIRTSRGQASVPAWRFGFKEMRATVDRVALDDRDVTPMPDVEVPGTFARGLVGAQSWERAHGTTVDFTVGVGACDKDVVGRAYETADVVVLGGTVSPPGAATACIELLKLDPVNVTLTAPVGERVVLDVASGRPLVLGRR